MISRHIDVMAVLVLLGGMALVSSASKVEIRDVFSGKQQVLVERTTCGPHFIVISLVPIAK